MTTKTIPIAKWTRSEYDNLIESGGFHPEKKVELINGNIIEMSPQNSLHATAVQLVHSTLLKLYKDNMYIRIQMPLALSDNSEPEPDIAVVSGNPRDHKDHHPNKAVLIVEVANTTLSYDRDIKKKIYASSNIDEYWILNLNDFLLEVYREPGDDSYKKEIFLKPSNSISPLSLQTSSIIISDLIP